MWMVLSVEGKLSLLCINTNNNVYWYNIKSLIFKKIMKRESKTSRLNIKKDGLHLKLNKQKMLLQTSCTRLLLYSQILGIWSKNELVFSLEHWITIYDYKRKSSQNITEGFAPSCKIYHLYSKSGTCTHRIALLENEIHSR